MCVIMASTETKVSREQIEAGFKENPWGAGLAWIDTGTKKTGPLVRWKKGLTNVEDVMKAFEMVKDGSPYVLHFRIPTEGLEDIELTHPFPINEGADIAFEGSTKGKLLFHNGKWETWRSFSLETCRAEGAKLPKGLLNDSRMMAWNAHFYGEEILQLINEKSIVFGLNDDGSVHFQLYGTDKTNGWNFKGDRNTAVGVWFSNDRWEKNLPKPAPITHLRQIKDRVSGGHGGDHQPQAGSFLSGWQPSDGCNRLSGGPSEQEQMERRSAGVSPRIEQDGKKLATSPAFTAQMAKVHQDQEALAWALHYNPKKFTRRVMGFLAEGSTTVN